MPAAPAEAQIRSQLPDLLPRLWRYGVTLSQQRETAEDLVQATCLRALERAAQFTADSRLDQWLFAIMHSIWIDEVRRRRVRLGQGLVDIADADLRDARPDAETRAMANQYVVRINALPPVQRTTAYLAYVEGFSYREVADTLAIPIGTVMSRLANARARLAEPPDGESLRTGGAA